MTRRSEGESLPGRFLSARAYDKQRMNKDRLAERLAKQSGIPTAVAADQLDEVLAHVLKRVRQGHSASLPGLGTFVPGQRPEFYFEACLPAGAQRPAQNRKARKKSQ